MVKLRYLAVLSLVAMAAPAHAATVVHNIATTGSKGVDGTYGNALTFASSTDSTLQVRVTGWQAGKLTGFINEAYLGAYDGGLGVTGRGDRSGAGALHQLDNIGLYTDFVMVQFSRAVSLTGVYLNAYQMSGVSGVDSDFAVWNAGALPSAAWNSSINLADYRNSPSIWTAISSSGSGLKPLTTGVSSKWLLSAAQVTAGDFDDGFKLAGFRVTEAVAPVPEPTTWAMMILGFGMAGGALRRRARTAPAALTA